MHASVETLNFGQKKNEQEGYLKTTRRQFRKTVVQQIA